MANPLQFDKHQPTRPECLRCEELLADAVDASSRADNLDTPGLLSEPDQARFDAHIRTCDQCSAAFADAVRGAAWLQVLKSPRPEPSARLLERILAATSEAESEAPQIQIAKPAFQPIFSPAPTFRPALLQPRAAVLEPIRPAANVLPFRPRAPHWGAIQRVMFEPRLAMTAAMAFFSIALTLSLTGVRLDQLHAANFTPSALRRQYFQSTATVARHTESLRVVHVLEARVADFRDLAHTGNSTDDPANDQAPLGAIQDRNPQPEPRPEARPEAEPQANPDSKPRPAHPDPNGVSRGNPATPRFLPVTIPTRTSHPQGGLA